MISPQLYWVMTGNDFSLDINNPKEPKLLCVGNNPDRQNIYSAALGLYNSRIVKLINKKRQLKCAVIIDELPTIYFRGLDNLIATARSNKVAVVLGFQDFSQLKRDYGDKEAAVIMSTVGNVFSGQVVGETAKTLSERFGKILQKRESMSINRSDTSTSISTQLDSLIPASKISTLSQGMFVGAVADNFGETIEQKIFHAEIVVDNAKVAAETKAYKPIPVITDFTDEHGNDCMKEKVQENYNRIKDEVKQIVKDELERIASDESLKHLLQKPVANLRKPYGSTIREMRRYASFIGTSNQKDLLSDPSGSRRFICIEVTGPIDTNVTINYRQLYAQALNAVAKGERYWLDDADEAILKRTNREFEQLTPLEQLFHSHFRAAEEDEEGQWMMPMQILSALQTKTRDRLAINKVAVFGRTLKKLEIPNKKSRQGTLYHVMPLD